MREARGALGQARSVAWSHPLDGRAALAEVMKLGGNEFLVWLLARSRLPPFILDFVLFLYEATTGTMARLVLLTIPNTAVVVGSSIAHTMVEYDTRNALLFQLTLAGKDLKPWMLQEKRAHDRACLARVIDTSNDQVRLAHESGERPLTTALPV